MIEWKMYVGVKDTDGIKHMGSGTHMRDGQIVEAGYESRELIGRRRSSTKEDGFGIGSVRRLICIAVSVVGDGR